MSSIQQRASLNLVLFLAIIQIAISTKYNVIPDNDDYDDNQTDYFSLQHYLNNTSEYFVSYNQFHFIAGQYYISDVIFKDIENFSLIGTDQCVITCTSPGSVLIINVTSFTFQSIKLINCIKSHKEYFSVNAIHFDNFDLLHARNAVPFSKVTQYHASVFLYNSSVTISDMDAIATVMTSFTAILIVNMQDISKLINVKVHISTFNCTMYQYNRSVRNSGIVIYYSDQDRIAKRIKLTINNFYYNNTAYKSCINHFHCVITILFLESGKKNKNFALDLEIRIQNSVFSNLKNSSILCYYGEAYNDKKYDDIRTRSVIITNSTISNNTGHHQLSMFYIVLKSLSRISTLFLLRRYEKKRLYNIFIFQGCVFAYNSDMNAVIYVKPPTTDAIVGHILINNSTFQKNINTNFITVKKEDQTLWYVTTYFRLYYVNIFSNEHSDGDSLLLVTSGIISLLHVNFNHNRYFGNVISLRSSMLLFRNYTNITNNYARHIVMAQSKSFLFINVFTTINISHNFVYKTIIQLSTFEKNAVPICPLQSHRRLN